MASGTGPRGAGERGAVERRKWLEKLFEVKSSFACPLPQSDLLVTPCKVWKSSLERKLRRTIRFSLRRLLLLPPWSPLPRHPTLRMLLRATCLVPMYESMFLLHHTLLYHPSPLNATYTPFAVHSDRLSSFCAGTDAFSVSCGFYDQELNNEWQIGISEPQKAGEGVMGTYMLYSITIKVRFPPGCMFDVRWASYWLFVGVIAIPIIVSMWESRKCTIMTSQERAIRVAKWTRGLTCDLCVCACACWKTPDDQQQLQNDRVER